MTGVALRGFFLGLSLIAFACTGDRGPDGTSGPAGPTGPRGPSGPTVPANELPCVQPDAGFPGVGSIGTIDTGLTCVETGYPGNRSAPFAVAMLICANLGLRLCTYGEWYNACKNFSDRITLLTNDWEWVDAVYPDGDGGVKGLLVGNGSCDAARLEGLGQPNYVRCCQ